MSGIRKSYLESVSYLMKSFPCVVILGARQVGKTTFLKSVRPDSPFFDLEKQSDFQLISSDPDFFLATQQVTGSSNPRVNAIGDPLSSLPPNASPNGLGTLV